jgi:hypothetical protein
VEVQNTSLLTKNLDEKGRVPYQAAVLVITSACSTNGILYFCDQTLPTVPTGKRLVLEHVSMFVALASGVPDMVRFLDPFTHGTRAYVQPTFTTRSIAASHFLLDRPVHVYYEPDQTPIMRIQTTGQPVSIELTAQGYLIDAN